MLDAIASDVDDQGTISFNGVDYPFNRDMLVDGELYGNAAAVVSHNKHAASPSAVTTVLENYSNSSTVKPLIVNTPD